jgi:hypothetical protein
MKVHFRRTMKGHVGGFITIIYAIAIAALSQAHEMELIENGSFEVDGPGGGSLSTTGWDDGPGQGNDIGLARGEYSFFNAGESQGGQSSFEFPPNFPDDFTGVIQPAGAGTFFGAGWGAANGNALNGSATQIVNLHGRGGRRYIFSAWMASQLEDPDYAILSLDFFADPNAIGDPLGSIIFDGSDQTSPFIVGSMNLDGFADKTIGPTQDNWTLYQADEIIPSSAQSAAVVIRGVSPPGTISGNVGFVDLVSLQLVPEPAAGILLLSGIFGGVFFVCVRSQVALS